MIRKVSFADPHHQEELQELLWNYDMDLFGEITEHLIIEQNDEIIAGARVIAEANNKFFLVAMAVKDAKQRKGYGSAIMEYMLSDPWRSSCMESESRDFQITTLARGKSIGFYRKHGFEPCDYEDVPEFFSEQCKICPEHESCQPLPMIFNGGKQ